MAIPKKWLNVLGDIIERLQHVEKLLDIRRDSSVCPYPARNGFYAVSTVDPIPIILAWFDGKWIWPDGTNKEFQCPEDIVNYSLIEDMPAETHSEPRPLLSDAQVGDLCQRANGKYTQFYHKQRLKDGAVRYYFSDSDGSVDINGKVNGGKNNHLDIISCDPLAAEGTWDRAIQEMKLGKKMYNSRIHVYGTSWAEYDAKDDSIITVNEKGYVATYRFLDKLHPAVETGWKTYELAPRLNVGDWVYNKGVYGKLIDIDTQKNVGNIETADAVYADRDMDSMEKIARSEVKVTLTLENVTVEKAFVHGNIDTESFLAITDEGLTYCLDYSSLSPAQVEMVRELCREGDEK